jgi:hypothetical protein
MPLGCKAVLLVEPVTGVVSKLFSRYEACGVVGVAVGVVVGDDVPGIAKLAGADRIDVVDSIDGVVDSIVGVELIADVCTNNVL